MMMVQIADAHDAVSVVYTLDLNSTLVRMPHTSMHRIENNLIV